MINLVTIVSYGTGNLASLYDAFDSAGAKCRVASSAADLANVQALVLPGVGHFGHAVRFLRDAGLTEPILALIKRGVPTLGICLGFQLLTLSSEEAVDEAGLGVLPLHIVRIRPVDTQIYKVPHLGWNTVHQTLGESKLLSGIEGAKQAFYYANGYGAAWTGQSQAPIATYDHGGTYIGLIEQENVFGVQFHPEKSRSQGLTLLRNFLKA